MAIGILALQGAFQEHADILKKLSVEYRFIRNITDLDTKFDGIILPGGESTVQRKLAKELGLLEPLKLLIKKRNTNAWNLCRTHFAVTENCR